MNVEIKDLRVDDFGVSAVANVYFLYKKTEYSAEGDLILLEENLILDFSYARKNGHLEMMHFDISLRTKHFDEHFNFNALERFRRSVVAFCEVAVAAKLCV